MEERLAAGCGGVDPLLMQKEVNALGMDPARNSKPLARPRQ